MNQIAINALSESPPTNSIHSYGLKGEGVFLGQEGGGAQVRVHKRKQSTHTAKNIRVTYELMYTFKDNAKAKPTSNTWVMVVPPSLFSEGGGVREISPLRTGAQA